MGLEIFHYIYHGQTSKIKLSDIIFLKAEKDTVQFYGEKHLHIIYTTLDEVLNKIGGKRFIKINNRFAVALDCIDNIMKDHLTISSVRGVKLPIDKKLRPALMERLEVIGQVVKPVGRQAYGKWESPLELTWPSEER